MTIKRQHMSTAMATSWLSLAEIVVTTIKTTNLTTHQ
jgi:hypothetical protein